MPAGGEHADQPRASQDRGDELGDTLDDVLAVVQQQQRRTVGEIIDDGFRLTRLQAERARHPLGHQRTVGERRQLDPPHPARKALRHARRDLPGQPGLAAATRARERHQPRFAEQPRAAFEVVRPPDERAQARPAGCSAPPAGHAPGPAPTWRRTQPGVRRLHRPAHRRTPARAEQASAHKSARSPAGQEPVARRLSPRRRHRHQKVHRVAPPGSTHRSGKPACRRPRG